MEKNTYYKVIPGLLFLLLLFSFILSISSVMAVTGKIGNARMILNLEEGDSLDRSIQVINDNNVSINISLVAEGVLKESLEVEDSEFILGPNEEKKAKFTVNADLEPGQYEGKIRVTFNPLEANESGVGLASNIILNVYEKGSLPDNSNTRVGENKILSSPIFLLVISTIILLAIAVVLVYISGKRKKESEKESVLIKHSYNGTKK